MRTNNLYCALSDFLKKPQSIQKDDNYFFGLLFLILIALHYASIRKHQQFRLLSREYSYFLDSNDFDNVDRELFASPRDQQRIFQWKEDELDKSTHVVSFLALFFGVNIRILSKTGVVTHSSKGDPANEDKFVNIKCEQEYTCSYENPPVMPPQDDMPQYSAFIHASGRQLVHEDILFILRRILDELRLPPFWQLLESKTSQHPLLIIFQK